METQNTERAQIQDRHSQAMSSVSIVVLGEPRRGRIEAGQNKNLPPKYRTFVFMPPLFTALRDWKRGRILADFVDCNRKKDLSMVCCAGTVCLCVSREVLWCNSQFRDMPPPPKPEELICWESPGGVQDLLFLFMNSGLYNSRGHRGLSVCLWKTVLV